MSGLKLDADADQVSGKSPLDQALDDGKAQVGGQERKVVKAKRTTDASKKE